MHRRIQRREAAPEARERGAPPEARQSFDNLFTVAYEELRRMAQAVNRNGADVTLNPTALVNEAWLKLAGSPSLAATSHLHFKRIAACAMRQVLVEAARRRNAYKRGGGRVLVTLDSDLAETGGSERSLLTLHEALSELERLEPRLAQLVESRFFGGLDVAETAALLNVSEATVQRDWRAARAWLKHKLSQAR